VTVSRPIGADVPAGAVVLPGPRGVMGARVEVASGAFVATRPNGQKGNVRNTGGGLHEAAPLDTDTVFSRQRRVHVERAIVYAPYLGWWVSEPLL